MYTVSFCYWEVEHPLLEKIKQAFIDLHNDTNCNVEVCNLKISEPPNNKYILAFGNQAQAILRDHPNLWKTYSLFQLLESSIYKRETFELLKQFSNFIKQEEEKELKVEKKNISLGIGADITITEEEANYLKKIKDLLNGGTIIIKKNDLEIRIEDK